MKGTVVSTWLQSLRRLHGDEQIEKAMSSVGWSTSRIITPLDDIKDEEAIRVVTYIAEKNGKTAAQLWKEIGRENIRSFREWFPSYFERSSLKSFLMMMDAVHAQITKMIRGATPPRMITTDIGPKQLELRYESKRGMTDYFLGLLEGGAEYFKENLKIEEIDRGKTTDGSNYLTVRLTMDKDNTTYTDFKLSKIMSLGFIRNIAVKTGLFSAIVSFLVFIISGTGLLWGAGYAAAVFIISAVFTNISIKPLEAIRTEIARLGKLDFADSNRISTGDDFEKITTEITTLREAIQHDFLFLKGGNDDMHSFTKAFTEISGHMKNVSEDISTIVHDVANGAVYQAEETEKSVATIATNMDALNEIAEKELSSSGQLGSAVENIRKSSQDTQHVTGIIASVRDDFARVNAQSTDLSRRVTDIMTIVTAVESIAEQTNLLALNAAIESARAGEMGRGFAVVADEIRKLAEDSKKSVKTINDNLRMFIDDVQGMIEQFGKQFTHLEESNETLEKVASDNIDSTEHISHVATDIVSLVEAMSSQTKQLASVIENVHSLAAIAEENSAASEEMSANVMEYSHKIGEMTDNIGEMDKLTTNFRTELSKYKI